MNINLSITAVLGAIAVTLGALGAHALKEKLSVEQLDSFEVAVRYQMYHVLALLLVNMYTGFSLETKQIISYLFFAAILCFSGSIYAIVFGVKASHIWFVTPIGGLLFIAGWLYTAYAFLQKSF